jgi:hypothetical protein
MVNFSSQIKHHFITLRQTRIIRTLNEIYSSVLDPFLGKDLETNNETTAVDIERCGNYTSTTMELLLEVVFSTRSVRWSHLKDNRGDPVSNQLRVEFFVGGCEERT